MTTRLRKNLHALTTSEWDTLVGAIRTLHDAHTPFPRWQHFVDLHAQAMDTAEGMTWGVHTMDMGGGTVMPGVHFLPWHREFLWRLENRLRDIVPGVTLPYWDWTVDRAIPAALSHAGDLAAWGITRNPHLDVSQLPTAANVNTALALGVSPPQFRTFQTALEDLHNAVHNAVGGTMATERSPADPLFWIHHAFVDKLWAHWENLHPGTPFQPPNAADTLKPAPVITHKVAGLLSITDLGYAYQ